MRRTTIHIPCDHTGRRLKRVGIQWSEPENGKLYLLLCPRCGSCVSTYSLRKQRAERRRAG